MGYDASTIRDDISRYWFENHNFSGLCSSRWKHLIAPSPTTFTGTVNMGYIERSLGLDETLIRRAHFHWLHRSLGYLALLPFLAAAAYLLIELHSLWLAMPTAALGLFVFLHIMLPLWTTEIGVTSDRLIVKRGWLTRSTNELELSAIEEVNVEQGIFGRLLDFGRISAQGTGDDSLNIPAIAAPLAFRKAIETALISKGRMAADNGSRRVS